MIGKKISEKDEEKIRILVGLAKSACEEMGGTYVDVGGKKVCITKIKEGSNRREILPHPNVDVLNVTTTEE